MKKCCQNIIQKPLAHPCIFVKHGEQYLFFDDILPKLHKFAFILPKLFITLTTYCCSNYMLDLDWSSTNWWSPTQLAWPSWNSMAQTTNKNNQVRKYTLYSPYYDCHVFWSRTPNGLQMVVLRFHRDGFCLLKIWFQQVHFRCMWNSFINYSTITRKSVKVDTWWIKGSSSP